MIRATATGPAPIASTLNESQRGLRRPLDTGAAGDPFDGSGVGAFRSGRAPTDGASAHVVVAACQPARRCLPRAIGSIRLA